MTSALFSLQLISGGTEAAVNHWYMNGDLKSKVPCTPTAVFNVAINTKSESNKVELVFHILNHGPIPLSNLNSSLHHNYIDCLIHNF